ncbi:acyl carrier protein [Agrilactobacillus fermenti]|uniref:acyl carrier protein n=1 Tax=Agrilactobacillus fermenti TaxID=2586909 RepID=UPI001E582058|nr:acyl carrier protein [Agrilactobacillus fermenti]MCD2255708.1 acyl carrier protein [Agrilactobacillus fermenti]
MANNEETFKKIQEIIADQLDKEPEEVKMESNFKNDFDADSLDIFEIINEIEDEFDVKIEAEEGIDTVKDLVEFVEKQA